MIHYLIQTQLKYYVIMFSYTYKVALIQLTIHKNNKALNKPTLLNNK